MVTTQTLGLGSKVSTHVSHLKILLQRLSCPCRLMRCDHPGFVAKISRAHFDKRMMLSQSESVSKIHICACSETCLMRRVPAW